MSIDTINKELANSAIVSIDDSNALNKVALSCAIMTTVIPFHFTSDIRCSFLLRIRLNSRCSGWSSLISTSLKSLWINLLQLWSSPTTCDITNNIQNIIRSNFVKFLPTVSHKFSRQTIFRQSYATFIQIYAFSAGTYLFGKNYFGYSGYVT